MQSRLTYYGLAACVRAFYKKREDNCDTLSKSPQLAHQCVTHVSMLLLRINNIFKTGFKRIRTHMEFTHDNGRLLVFQFVICVA